MLHMIIGNVCPLCDVVEAQEALIFGSMALLLVLAWRRTRQKNRAYGDDEP